SPLAGATEPQRRGGPETGGASAEDDSLLLEEIDWLIDSLAVFFDSPGVAADFGAEFPDISDSLAALTQARLPSTEEIFDYPVTINRRVLTWIDFFLGRGRKSFERSLVRSGRYLAMARETFRQEGIPQDLVFLGHVESGFQVNALSHARALGLWQFMRGTAKLCGLRCDAYVDERLDPEKATRAAARHLGDLYERYGDWYLAMAAYNAGPGGVDRAIQRSGTRDFWQIAQTRRLHHETRNFVPAILAATILAKSPGAYGLTEETDAALNYDTITVGEPIDLRVIARSTGMQLSELERLNPALLIGQTPPLAEKYELHVPLGLGDTTARRLAQIRPEERLLHERHKVRSGENLAVIAKRYGTTVRAIQDANRLGRRTLIHAGQTLLIPGRGGSARSPREDYVASGGDPVAHRVRRGETLSRIAALYGVGLDALLKANKLSNPNRLQVGQQLTIPVGRAATKPAAPPEPAIADAASGGPGFQVEVLASRALMARNNSETLGRVPSTAHIVEHARLEIGTAEVDDDGPGQAGKTSRAQAQRPAAGAGTQTQTYTVRRGDTLGKIGQRFGATVAQLRGWNNLRSGALIYPGQKLAVSASAAPPQASLAQRGESPAQGANRTHVVKRGDSLWKIGQRYGVKTDDIARWNGISRSAKLLPGQKLKIL
ncbi:MAG: LysM peptidoglycan-binding domain-containing protein, partial [Candidatus Eisenbacteria bacterium]|nr:LysM peptidoglycan-binding domain-containing protein [Candidatus Eisenbacteria bacterium]